MKLGLLLALCLSFQFSAAQYHVKRCQERFQQFEIIRDLVRNDDATALSELISYPLDRGTLLPAIETPEEFVAAYPTLFDDGVKAILENQGMGPDDCMIKDVYAIMDGDIWIGLEGKITMMGGSGSERKIHDRLLGEMHPSVGKWYQKKMFCQDDRFTFLVDDTWYGDASQPGNYGRHVWRLVGWSAKSGIAEEPELVLENGLRVDLEVSPVDQEKGYHGESYVFRDGELTYRFDNVYHPSTLKTMHATIQVERDGVVLAETQTENYPVYRLYRDQE